PARQAADAAAGPQARAPTLSPLRHPLGGGLLRRASDDLLPGRPDRRPHIEGPPPFPPAQVNDSERERMPSPGGRRAAARFVVLRSVVTEPPGEGIRSLPQAGSMSMVKSSVGAEWVRAPTDMKSTPASAMVRAVSRLTPPEASRDGPFPPGPFSSRKATAPR